MNSSHKRPRRKEIENYYISILFIYTNALLNSFHIFQKEDKHLVKKPLVKKRLVIKWDTGFLNKRKPIGPNFFLFTQWIKLLKIFEGLNILKQNE